MSSPFTPPWANSSKLERKFSDSKKIFCALNENNRCAKSTVGDGNCILNLQTNRCNIKKISKKGKGKQPAKVQTSPHTRKMQALEKQRYLAEEEKKKRNQMQDEAGPAHEPTPELFSFTNILPILTKLLPYSIAFS